MLLPSAFRHQDELYQLCVMDTRPTVDYPEDLDIVGESGDIGDEGDIEESGASEEEHDDMPPTPVVGPACDEVDAGRGVKGIASSPISMNVEADSPRRRRAMAESAFFNT